jgi:predicted transcriptional regulator
LHSGAVGLKLFLPENKLKTMSAKETLLEVAEKLPPNATLVDAIYELEFRQAVEEGLASLDGGERIPLEEARKRIPQWISKSSSPKKR